MFESKRVECDTLRLLPQTDVPLSALFDFDTYARDWSEFSRFIFKFPIPNETGGVNPVDRRLIYQLVRLVDAKSVLECGTHIGSSTTSIAAALLAGTSPTETSPLLITVDIKDVNSTAARPWLHSHATMAPKEMISRLGADSFVRFIHSDSLTFLRKCEETFDLIFLDGDHSARTVYQEVPLCINRMKPGGVLLLHDYFPDWGRPLSQKLPITGPYSAVSKLIDEGLKIKAVPLRDNADAQEAGCDSTSLALITRARD